MTPTRLTPGGDVLAASLRRLLEASVRTTVDEAEVRATAEALDALSEGLERSSRQGPWVPDLRGRPLPPYNPVVGEGNPVAAPLVLTRQDEHGVCGEVRFGTVYEGGPGLVHGGVLSLVLDQVFGEAALAAEVGGMTIGLELRYLAPTHVDADLVVEAHVLSAGDRIVELAGSITEGGTTTVTATATFFRLTAKHAKRIFG